MKRILLLMFIIVLLHPCEKILATNPNEIKAAFIRNGDLFLYQDNIETQITETGSVMDSPSWSSDGQMIAFQKSITKDGQDTQTELWIYSLKTKKTKKIYANGHSPKWAPNAPLLAFNDNGLLNLSDLTDFRNISLGVSDYTWFPNGKSFLLSSSGNLSPTGWSSARLYTQSTSSSLEHATPFFSLPKEIGKGENKITPINISDMQFSPSGKWVSFIASMTASIAMDSNMLCILSKDGKDFTVLDEIIFEVGLPKWAPSKDTIAYIEGGGRIVLGFKNKHLTIKDIPVNGNLTPKHYADLDFDWVNNDSLISSRVAEKEWDNNPENQPHPSLHWISVQHNKQKQITFPPNGFGDYQPVFIPTSQKICWFRGHSLSDQHKDLWIANPDGTDSKKWIDDVDLITFPPN